MPLARLGGVPTNIIQSLSITYLSATPALPGQMVDYAGNLATTPGTPVFGVLRSDGIQGKVTSVATTGLVEAIAGGAVAVGAVITSDATGRGVTAAAGNQIIGRAVSATTAVGQKFQLLITREGTT